MYSEAARPVRRVVREAHGLGLGLELDDRQDRPLGDLLARDRHVVADVVEDRGRDEVAAGLLEDPLAAGDDRAPLAPADVDVAQHASMSRG